jgi:hypothetical protein
VRHATVAMCPADDVVHAQPIILAQLLWSERRATRDCSMHSCLRWEPLQMGMALEGVSCRSPLSTQQRLPHCTQATHTRTHAHNRHMLLILIAQVSTGLSPDSKKTRVQLPHAAHNALLPACAGRHGPEPGRHHQPAGRRRGAQPGREQAGGAGGLLNFKFNGTTSTSQL